MINLKKNKKRKRVSGTRDLITGGVTAIIGTALLAQTSSIINRI